MRTYDTRAFYIPDPAPDRRSVSTTSADEEDLEETSLQLRLGGESS